MNINYYCDSANKGTMQKISILRFFIS